jgi:hypothetical protein
MKKASGNILFAEAKLIEGIEHLHFCQHLYLFSIDVSQMSCLQKNPKRF